MTKLAPPKVECVESTRTYGRFVAEPLERGFGITLGNSLRRVLLGSLLGAAVTLVKIEGVQHEFSVIPYVKEDTLDFLLNIKSIRIRPLSQRPGILRLDVEGEGEVYAADIKPSADFEIVNPELHLATLDSPEAELHAEFDVEMGIGYEPGVSSDGLPLGAIPVDAIFTPVRKVNYTVEPSGLGQKSSQEKLILEIWTDGTISAAEAASQSAATIVDQCSPFLELVKIPAGEGAELALQRLIPPEQYSMSLEQLNLSVRTHNTLRRGGIITLGQLLEQSIEGLPPLPGFGAKSQKEVETMIEALGFPFVSQAKEKKKDKHSKTSSSEGDVKNETSDSGPETG